MTASQEMVLTLLSPTTLSMVKQQFQKGTEIFPIDSFDMNFRLFKPTDFNVNLEILTQIKSTNQNIIPFFKTIGFYTVDNGYVSIEIEITILKEFENDLDYLIKEGKVPSNIKIKRLSTIENAVLAGYSMEAVLNATRNIDCSTRANGLDVDIYMTGDDEYSQLFLNDKYNIRGHIVAYFFKQKNQGIATNLKYEEMSNKFQKMSLFSAFKKL